MGFNKRVIDKEYIDYNINDLDFIIKSLDCDSLITDYWSHYFFKNLNFDWVDYQNKRNILIKEYENISNIYDVENHKLFLELRYMSNIYINLLKNPNFIDILLFKSIIDFNISDNNIKHIIKNIINKINKIYHNHE